MNFIYEQESGGIHTLDQKFLLEIDTGESFNEVAYILCKLKLDLITVQEAHDYFFEHLDPKESYDVVRYYKSHDPSESKHRKIESIAKVIKNLDIPVYELLDKLEENNNECISTSKG